jgi:WD40 repeat protein
MRPGERRGRAGVVWAIALTPDGRRAVVASEDFTARVWNVAAGACEAVLLGHTGWVVDVAITADGAHALTASHDLTARCARCGTRFMFL